MSTRTFGFKKGDKVQWHWGQGIACGRIQAHYTEKVTRTINGKNITRNATTDEPAYLIVQDDGQEVLKSESELENA